MDGLAIQDRAAACALELPGAQMTHPFGPAWDVYKVEGKVFMLLTEVTGEPIVVLKAPPSESRSLREAHADITPGYHMNKKHWITLVPGGSLEPSLVDDLVRESYLLVVESLPKHRRPVDPGSLG